MKSVLIATADPDDAQSIKAAIEQYFEVDIIAAPNQADGRVSRSDLVLLDNNFTENSGIDFLMQIMNSARIPVLLLTPPEDPKCAIEALRAGASNYIVKTINYEQLLSICIRDTIDRFEEMEGLKRSITALQTRVKELEERLADKRGVNAGDSVNAEPGEDRPQGPEDTQEEDRAKTAAPKKKTPLVESIISLFKRGEIDLPSLPQITTKFNEMLRSGAGLREIAVLLKQDVAISSKLISISNTAYYRGMTENKTLEQAIGRLGMGTTRQYVELISNRALYYTANGSFTGSITKLWTHSLSCSHACQITAETLGLDLKNDPFTMGLLHDIGRLLLLKIVSELELQGKFNQEDDGTDLLKTLQTFHGKFGAILLKKWGFPEEFLNIAMYHDDLRNADSLSGELLTVHFANLLAKSMGYGQNSDDDSSIENAESIPLLHVEPSMVLEIKNRVKELMESTEELFA
jgi:HD-like signal output (HDOD) protein/AmiR/NasT family two-component response regulator